MTLRKLLAIDRTAKLNGTLESSLRTTLSCSRSRFLKLAVEVLESIFNNGCALFCRREELTRLCEQVEALLAEGADRAAFRPVVDEIKRTLSCGGVIDAHKKIRLQERLKKR